jgi:hypothetical protein
MEKTLRGISKYTIMFDEMDFTDEQLKSNWLGFPPSTSAAIKATEQRLCCILPEDYKTFLGITNGFSQICTSVYSTFLPVEKIDFLINLDLSLIETWEEGALEVGHVLRSSILIGGLNESQQVLLIPQKSQWVYWQFADWIPKKRLYENLNSYLEDTLEFLEGRIL